MSDVSGDRCEESKVDHVAVTRAPQLERDRQVDADELAWAKTAHCYTTCGGPISRATISTRFGTGFCTSEKPAVWIPCRSSATGV